MVAILTTERLRQVLDYDPKTGVFNWRVSPAQNVPAGARAGGARSDGYVAIRVDGKRYKAHRLAWLYMYGKWPTGRLDHRDTIRDHNWIGNLRLATNSQNKANMRKRRDNTSGYKGVSFYKQTNRWVAQIGCRGRNKRIGYFATPEEAHAAYCLVAKQMFGEFARGD